jgi:prolipoprotein diacylglyceryltransferase
MARWVGRDVDVATERFAWLSPLGLVVLFAAGIVVAVWMSRCGDALNEELIGNVVTSATDRSVVAPPALRDQRWHVAVTRHLA